jgi:hypothetical protein
MSLSFRILDSAARAWKSSSGVEMAVPVELDRNVSFATGLN